MADKTCHTCQHFRGEDCALFKDRATGRHYRAHAARRVGGQCGPTAHFWKLKVSTSTEQPQQASKSHAGSIFGHAQHGHLPPARSRALAGGVDRKRAAGGDRDDD